jgi:hypothetical protein
MKVSAEFSDGACTLLIRPSDEWEERLLGAIAKGGVTLDGQVNYEPVGHYTNGRAKVVAVKLTGPGD